MLDLALPLSDLTRDRVGGFTMHSDVGQNVGPGTAPTQSNEEIRRVLVP